MALTHAPHGGLRPVYVTGLGLVSAAGADVGAAWAGIAAGRPVVTPVRRFDIRGCECQVAAHVDDQALIPTPARARWPRFVQLGRTAFDAALKQAGLLGAKGRSLDPALPLFCSTTGGGTEYGEACILRARAGRRVGIVASAMRYQAQYLPYVLQETYGLRGAATTLSNACASGADLIGAAASLVASGRVERIAAGGAESLSSLLFHGFSCLRALSPTTCRPFSLSRNGLWLGEGAAFVVLESAAEVRRRQVTPLARLAGYGQATDLHHIAHPHPQGLALAQALRQALAQAGVAPEEVAYLNTHGTATPANDVAEANAYESVFGHHLPRVALSSIKNITGHTLGAAGVIEAVLTIEAMRRGAPLPAAALDDPLPNVAASLAKSREPRADGRAFVSTNSGFGGANAALVFLGLTMQFNFNIAGIGAVSPAGQGLDRLLDGTVPRLQNCPTLSSSAPTVAAGCVDLDQPGWTRWRTHPHLRRAGSMTLFLVEAVDEAIRRANLPPGANVGLSVAFANGALTLTRKFYEGVARAGVDGANPAWFPETVYNAPLNHTLGALGREGPSSAWVGDATALAQAWVNAGLWLEQGTVDAVVVAAAEEVDEAMMEVSLRAGWFQGANKVFPAEGAVAFVLTRDGPIETQGNFRIHSGLPWGRQTAAPRALGEVLADFDSSWPVCAGPVPPPGPARHAWRKRPARTEWPASGPYLGEAHSTSAGWTLARILGGAQKEKFAVVLPLWGAGHQVAAVGWESFRHCVEGEK